MSALTERNGSGHVSVGESIVDGVDAAIGRALELLCAALVVVETVLLFAGVIARYRPDAAVIEETFVNRNPASALKLGQARGVALLAPARAGVPVAEYAANAIKKAVVGVGHADKGQVQMMVQRLLPGVKLAGADAADALAVAICHAHHSATRQRWQALGAVAPTPLLASEAAAALIGQPLNEKSLAAAAEAARAIISPIDDMRGTIDFRRHVTGVLVERVVREAAHRAAQ